MKKYTKEEYWQLQDEDIKSNIELYLPKDWRWPKYDDLTDEQINQLNQAEHQLEMGTWAAT